MPLLRYSLSNEYSLGRPELYAAAAQQELPEPVLEGLAAAGLVGILRQLGDLVEFAAEVFQDLHEEVVGVASRARRLALRTRRLEDEIPVLERGVGQEFDPGTSSCSAVDWHAAIEFSTGMVTRQEVPQFIMQSLQECRGPPKLYMLDKFDPAGRGACLRRYTNPGFFKTDSAYSCLPQEHVRRMKRPRRAQDAYWNLKNTGISAASSSDKLEATESSDEVPPRPSFRRCSLIPSLKLPMQKLFQPEAAQSTESVAREDGIAAEERRDHSAMQQEQETAQQEDDRHSEEQQEEEDHSESSGSEGDAFLDAATTVGSETDTDTERRRSLSRTESILHDACVQRPEEFVRKLSKRYASFHSNEEEFQQQEKPAMRVPSEKSSEKSTTLEHLLASTDCNGAQKPSGENPDHQKPPAEAAEKSRKPKESVIAKISFKKLGSKKVSNSDAAPHDKKRGMALSRKLSEKDDPFSFSLRSMAKELLESKYDPVAAKRGDEEDLFDGRQEAYSEDVAMQGAEEDASNVLDHKDEQNNGGEEDEKRTEYSEAEFVQEELEMEERSEEADGVTDEDDDAEVRSVSDHKDEHQQPAEISEDGERRNDYSDAAFVQEKLEMEEQGEEADSAENGVTDDDDDVEVRSVSDHKDEHQQPAEISEDGERRNDYSDAAFVQEKSDLEEQREEADNAENGVPDGDRDAEARDIQDQSEEELVMRNAAECSDGIAEEGVSDEDADADPSDAAEHPETVLEPENTETKAPDEEQPGVPSHEEQILNSSPDSGETEIGGDTHEEEEEFTETKASDDISAAHSAEIPSLGEQILNTSTASDENEIGGDTHEEEEEEEEEEHTETKASDEDAAPAVAQIIQQMLSTSTDSDEEKGEIGTDTEEEEEEFAEDDLAPSFSDYSWMINQTPVEEEHQETPAKSTDNDDPGYHLPPKPPASGRPPRPKPSATLAARRNITLEVLHPDDPAFSDEESQFRNGDLEASEDEHTSADMSNGLHTETASRPPDDDHADSPMNTKILIPPSPPRAPKFSPLDITKYDRSMLKKVPALIQPSKKLFSDERSMMLEQIKNKSFNLRPVLARRPNVLGGPRTNLKVHALLERANAIRQAVASRDEEDDWSD